ncbi:DNA polymerase IV [Fervidicella metallireducens AeB]|uniref:DNA polymerase IV n=1 Tax=Fervidicella metallireducens AeB TaxID=1403537 RepID=A0A017RTW1_9CLOT|nr:DNA polymerase IV [Fervidicella metallireducens]EYE88087.1 DNA polymerase IV [Fervidicella metallireducens AeB]
MRKILHVDLNAFYASVEQALNPDLEGLPVAVAGDKEKRTGIILTSSYEARKFGVKTGMTVGDAKNLCPNLVLVKPNFKNYMSYSIRVMDILRSFSPDVEQFSIDEAWVDVTGCEHLFGDGAEIADKIRHKIKDELNITASVGVSYCKLVAKMASDLKKPDATTVVMKEDLEKVIWPLPINDLMGVGRKTRIKLNDIGIFTIGDLANSSLSFIEKRFGKVGRYLWYFANGIDNSKVSTLRETAKGIGNSITTPRDIVNLEEASEVLMVLSESVGKRLREHGLEGDVIEITVRTSDFNTFVRQRKIYHHTDTTYEIHKNALKLLSENWVNENRIRLLGVRVTGLRESSGFKQMSFFEEKAVQKNEVLDRCMDTIRDKYGKNAIVRASMMVNESHKSINIVSDKEWTPMNPFNKGGGNL